ncbi:hypothetical protein [Streptomyces syringium]|uniref:hypothetical protein n=1 Tax=Streptomyces syringium TaxID=76729 RepID=UPI0033D7ED43
MIRDELHATFFRAALLIINVAGEVILYFPAALLLGVIIGSLVVGHLDRTQIYVHIATLVTTATASVLVVVAETCIDGVLLIDWPFIDFLVLCGFEAATEIPVEKSSDDGSKLNATANPDTEALSVDPIHKRAYQSPSRGRALTVLGWALGALGLLLAIICHPLYDALVSDFPLWVHPLLGFVFLVPSFLLWNVGNVLLQRGRRNSHRIIPSLEELTGERYLLYLRPFAIDSAMALPPDEAPGWITRSPFELPGTHEEFLVRHFRGLGRIVAIGQPGELLPALGAERGYLPVDNWKDTVSKLIQGAHAVIMMAAPGPGTAWEFTEALRTATPTRLLLLVYGEGIYHAFREDAADEYAARSSAEPDVNWPPLPQLPDIPPPAPYAKGIRWDFPFEGILSFDNQWRPQFTRFLPTVPRIRHVWTIRRLARRELDPILGPLSRLPPAPPLP